MTKVHGLQMSNWVTAAQRGDDRTVPLAAFTLISSRLTRWCPKAASFQRLRRPSEGIYFADADKERRWVVEGGNTLVVQIALVPI